MTQLHTTSPGATACANCHVGGYCISDGKTELFWRRKSLHGNSVINGEAKKYEAKCEVNRQFSVLSHLMTLFDLHVIPFKAISIGSYAPFHTCPEGAEESPGAIMIVVSAFLFGFSPYASRNKGAPPQSYILANLITARIPCKHKKHVLLQLAYQ